MRIAILGANGLLGQSLLSLPVVREHTIFPLDQQELDITDTKAVVSRFDELAPELIINVAAYNAVDAAESSAEGRQSAFRINADAVGVLAKAAHTIGATFVHYSTDYVFDGLKEVPYVETDTPNPLSVYGESKCKGEEYVLREIDLGLRGYVIRTSRLFGGANATGQGKESFPDLVLRLCGEKQRLEFIDGFE
ncbi:MAG: sugar nucleotide-binding protein, partial [Patescibacteria group bacterium]